MNTEAESNSKYIPYWSVGKYKGRCSVNMNSKAVLMVTDRVVCLVVRKDTLLFHHSVINVHDFDFCLYDL